MSKNAARVNARGKARIKQVFRCVGTAKEQSGARAVRAALIIRRKNAASGGNTMDALKTIAQDSMKSEIPAFGIGDTVKVHVRITEGDKSRIQIFEGTVIAKKHGGINETFTVRRVAHGCGIERVFPVHSPSVDKIEVVRTGVVRRAKLYYLRDRVGKAAKVKAKY